MPIDVEDIKRQIELTATAAKAVVTEAGFKAGIANRRRAFSLLAGLVPPDNPPTYIELDQPFLIWATPTNQLIDTHYEPLNSWAKVRSDVSGDNVLASHELSFYFLWQNDTGSDAVVNVESYLMLQGRAEIHASHGWFWSPLWGQSTIGEIDYSLGTNLTILEWWNQPPTQPVDQVGQHQTILSLSVNGGWGFLSPGKTKFADIASVSHLYYDGLLVPNGKSVVFQVRTDMNYVAFNTCSGWTDFSFGNNEVICPYLHLEVFVPTVVGVP